MIEIIVLKKIPIYRKYLIFIILMVFSIGSFSQNESAATKILDSLIAEKNYKEAEKALREHIALLTSKTSYFLLTDYAYYVGKINLGLKNQSAATKAVHDFLGNITKSTDSAKVLRQSQLELATYYELIGDSEKAYEANLSALEFTKKWKQATPEDYGMIENNLGTLANRAGDMIGSIKHHRKAEQYYESYPKTDYNNRYIIYNSLGGSMWFLSKIDSALYFYENAEKMLKLMAPNPTNSFYRPATLNNNKAAIYSTQGNLDKALEAMRLTINYLGQFIKSDISDAKKESGREFLYMAIENYAGIYKNMGDFEKAKELLEYSYNEKQKHLNPENPALYISQILLGQIHLVMKDYKKAESYLNSGIAHINASNTGPNYWNADAQYSKAQLHAELGNTALAKQLYDHAGQLYESMLDGSYDELYLDFTIKASHFYAKHNEKDRAIAMAEKAYVYIKENQGSTTSFEIEQALNLGEIYYELGDYKLALDQSITTEELLKKNLPTQNNPLDSTKIIYYKPRIILLKSRSAYQLHHEQPDAAFLKKEFGALNEAIAILDQQKSLVGDDANVSILIENNSEIYKFGRQIALELYEKTHEKQYLTKALSLHESILYNRIRSRLSSRSSMNFAHIPEAVIQRESQLKKTIKETLNGSNTIEAFIKANSEWNAYLANLKKEYPKYYKLKFASISKSLKDIEQKIPENATVVKYLYSNNALYAVVISKNDTELFKLEATHLKSKLASLQKQNERLETDFKTLHDLYLILWQPFAEYIATDRVVIVPDRDLFNLNFEMLTSQKVSNLKEMAAKSLLSKHIISYNYSLFLIDKGSKTVGYDRNFVAFVPEFNDAMKSNYKISIKDSLNLDKAYLSLLSQPFTKTLAQKSVQLFNGDSFLNEKSTKTLFKNNAKEHKIIHIGTHAESNNLSPELSRLVFAKPMDSAAINDNYLYIYEIYNTDLSSNLAILTACETGKPTYQAGEGMISLAHAFNYAGSESILTSLWKIDEQSSTKITESFYKYLKKGWTKDEALQQAKLDYISTAEGRTAHPQYWAGLVLIGDTAPIALQSTSSLIYWIAGLLCLIVSFLFWKRK